MEKAYEVHWIEDDEVKFTEFIDCDAAEKFAKALENHGIETYVKEIQA
jgi:hypothetical protein